MAQKLFDAGYGRKVARMVYERILERENVALWYDNYAIVRYDIDECWARAAGDAMDAMDLDATEVTGIMAWCIIDETADWI